jgi:N-acetylglucosamine kinase-like BadF-type ATPase
LQKHKVKLLAQFNYINRHKEKEGQKLNYIVGIDGGGTNTTMEIRSIQNKYIKRKTYGAFNINSTGQLQFERLLKELFEELVPISNCQCICIGAAGISNPLVNTIISDTLEKYHFNGKLLLKGDHEIALQGALGNAEGMILISGTGSICYGKGRDGRIVRAGGWGHMIDDGGSAYAIARDGFAAVMQSCDGRIGYTMLTDLYFQELNIHRPEEIVPYLYHPQTDKGKIAAFAPLVEQAASQGDSIALEIIKHNSALLMELIKAVYHNLSVPGAKVALLGGLMTHDTLLRANIIDQINLSDLKIKYEDALSDAVAGAVALALDAISADLK